MKKIIFYTLFFLCFQLKFSAQNILIDSLENVIKKAKHDSIKINSYIKWKELLKGQDPEKDILLSNKIIFLVNINLKKKLRNTEKNYYNKKLVWAINNIGTIYFNQNNNDSALYFFQRALKEQFKFDDNNRLASIYNNIGLAHERHGDYSSAMKKYYDALKINELMKNKKGISDSYGNIGGCYYYQFQFSKAIHYYLKSLKIKEEIGDILGQQLIITNIAFTYSEFDDYPNAIKFLMKNWKISSESKDTIGMTSTYSNIGVMYGKQNKNDSAIYYFKKSIEFNKDENLYAELNAKGNLAECYSSIGNYPAALKYYNEAFVVNKKLGDLYNELILLKGIGSIYKKMKNKSNARKYYLQSMSIAQESGMKAQIMSVFLDLSDLDSTFGNYKGAYENYKMYIIYRDSLTNEENTKQMVKQEMQYEFDKKSAADSIANTKQKEIDKIEISKQKAELKAKQNQQIALYGGLILVIVFAGFIFNRFKISQKQKQVIEKQKHLVEEKNKEITDSIRYAKRIQNAILPPTKLVKEYLPQSFILYKPKDIVAGDFYWMEHKNGKILFAAADCTGHGVPGAMVSVVCNNGLNRSVREHGLTDPSEILYKTREIVIKEFEKSDEEVKDGMDIAVCSLYGNQLQYAGANNPLWIIRNGELLETKADKQPIGKYAEEKPFTTHTFELQPNDSIYIFTDGFHDQFGGDKGKKFKASKMKELILSIQDKTMDEQKIIINNTFENWKGELDQVDDVCIIGVKI